MIAQASVVEDLLKEMVRANRILAREEITDAYGHVSVRHPERPDRYLLSRARSPQLVEAADFLEYTLDGEPVEPRGRISYSERFIHAAIYQARPEIKSVVHSHSLETVPFGCAGETIRPMLHNCALIGGEVPVWDPRPRFGDTDLMVTDMALGRDLAQRLGKNACALMRGHGSVCAGRSLRRAVYIAIKLHESARLMRETARFAHVTYLSAGEMEKMAASLGAYDDRPLMGIDRAWEFWCQRAGVPFDLLEDRA